MISRSSLATPILLATTVAIGACAGGPLDPPAPAVAERSYVCDDGSRLLARFMSGTQRTLVFGWGGDPDQREVYAPKNTLELVPADGKPLHLVQGPPTSSVAFYYHADGYGFTGAGTSATLTTPAGSSACRIG